MHYKTFNAALQPLNGRSPAPISYARYGSDLIGGQPNSRGFAALLSAYRASGGTLRGDEMARLLQARQRGDFVSLDRLMVSGEVFGFDWNHAWWVPMFQFEPRDLSIKFGVRRVLAELLAVFDHWALAAWFAQPNALLQGWRPIDLLDANGPAVFAAARADRFVAAGSFQSPKTDYSNRREHGWI